MKTAIWIHCLTQVILAATLVFYFDQLHSYILHLAKGKVYLPMVTHYAVHWRSILWLIPVAFVASAFLIHLRGMTPDRYAIFSACSILMIVALVGIAVLATSAPFWHGDVIVDAP